MLEKNDIVQITDENHKWFPSLIVVSEVKSWGIQGYTHVPTNDDTPNAPAYIRLKEGEYEQVAGQVIIGTE